MEINRKLNFLDLREEDAIENMIKLFLAENFNLKQFIKDINEQLIRNSIIVIKRLKKDKTTLEDLNTLISNPIEGRKIVEEFMKLLVETEAEQKENLDVGVYFLESYFNENSMTYKNCKLFREFLMKLMSD